MENVSEDIIPVETPETEIGEIIQGNDPLSIVLRLEQQADLAPRFIAARNKLLVSCTFPQDWEIFGEGENAKACLGSAGAERLASGGNFGIKFTEVKYHKEEFQDENGQAYRYVFEGFATLANRRAFAIGQYSTRDKFLGYAKQEWRPLEDINENNIRNAAYHIFQGNAIKVLLGLRGFPADEYNKLMNMTGQNADKTTGHSYKQGSQGGSDKKTVQDDTKKQNELRKLIIDVVRSGHIIEIDNAGEILLTEQEIPTENEVQAMLYSCKALSSFYSKKDKKIVDGKDKPDQLTGKRLSISLDKLKKLMEAKNVTGTD